MSPSLVSITLIALPLVMAVVAYVVPGAQLRAWLVPATGTVQLALSIVAVTQPAPGAVGAWLYLDDLGRVLLGLTSTVYVLCAFYVPFYLQIRAHRDNRLFVAAILAFLGLLSLHAHAAHVGLMWLAMETLTLTAAPLVYFNRNPRSLEATWKYLLIGSVGIATALLGSFFLAYSALQPGQESSLLFKDLLQAAPTLSRPWLDSAFVLLLVGYGTKMGLAPLHTWKPDAYGEAPGVVGALLAGCVTSCAFVSVLRFFQITSAAGANAGPRRMLIALGLLSMLVAAIFMARQRDYKRLLAYSSVEHMGILVLGVGIGGPALFGALLHLIANGLTKGALFLAVGNIQRAFGSRKVEQVQGALVRTPASAVILMAGFFAVTGAPPAMVFFSEFTILRGAIEQGQLWIAAAYLSILLAIFVGFSDSVLRVAFGKPPAIEPEDCVPERIGTVVPAAGFLTLSIALGLWLPATLSDFLRHIAALLETTP